MSKKKSRKGSQGARKQVAFSSPQGEKSQTSSPVAIQAVDAADGCPVPCAIRPRRRVAGRGTCCGPARTLRRCGSAVPTPLPCRSLRERAVPRPDVRPSQSALAIRSQIWGRRNEAFLSWFATADLPRRGRILDVGCDIGIQTCFYAWFFPDSRVTGIDRCGKSVRCAERLAERLNLKNVQFTQADLHALPDELLSQRFDMVVSTCVVGHFCDGPTIPVRSIEEAQSQAIDPQRAEYAGLMAGFLADEDSLLVSFDRLTIPAALARWIWALS